jgi:hypothetical protein
MNTLKLLLSFPRKMTVLSSTPSLSPSPGGRGKTSPSPSGGRVGKGEAPSPNMYPDSTLAQHPLALSLSKGEWASTGSARMVLMFHRGGSVILKYPKI